jgi:alpha-glucosidase
MPGRFNLPMMADYPSAYRQQPLARVQAAIPSTWDDTRALVARVGEEVAIARRSGSDWWIGVMTDRNARDVGLPLSFLPAGKFLAEIYQDDLASPYGCRHETREMTASDTLGLQVAESGGALVRLTPIRVAGPVPEDPG